MTKNNTLFRFITSFLFHQLHGKVVLAFSFSFSQSNTFPNRKQYVTAASSIYKMNTYSPIFQLSANFITFDLDDTIFPVEPVIAHADKALIHHLGTLGCSTTRDNYLRSTKIIRTELSKQENIITYTELRKRAIKMEMMKSSSSPTNEIIISDKIVSDCYDVWEQNRHSAANIYLYHDAILMLEEIKEKYPDVIIAAITNGKANPLKMTKIRKYFDYCVSGEDNDVFPLRKPHHGIYNVAMERYKELCKTRGTIVTDMDEICWIHVGDDLANDVGASAECGAYAVWADLVGEEYNQTASRRDVNTVQPIWSTATKVEIEKRTLLNREAKKYISERITTLRALPKAVQRITKLKDLKRNVTKF